jgi:hypothetical protein
MEGCGGAEGFLEVQTILADPQHYDYRFTKQWVEDAYWTPLDLRRMNQNLRDSHRRCAPTKFLW